MDPTGLWRESRKSRPALLSNLLGLTYWFKRKRKGKGLLSTSFSSSPSVSSNNKGQGCMPLFFSVSITKCQHGKKLRWELTNVPRAQPAPPLSSAAPPCLISVLSLQPSQASNCNQEYWLRGLHSYELIFSSLWVTADEYLNVWSLICFHVGTFSQWCSWSLQPIFVDQSILRVKVCESSRNKVTCCHRPSVLIAKFWPADLNTLS